MPMMKTIRALHRDDRPREKLRRKGPQCLSDMELLAVLLGSGCRKCDVLTLAGHLLKIMDQKGTTVAVDDLMPIPGVGAAKASIIVAAIEFSRRRIRPHGQKISRATDVFPMIRYLADRRQEHFLCLSLNGANEIINIRTISVGLVNRALVHPREVYADAITDRAAAVIVAHNHPSGNLLPSADDLAITNQLKQAGQTLGITLLDHIIFDQTQYHSLAEAGHL
jgi:DNA repair protein RadC